MASVFDLFHTPATPAPAAAAANPTVPSASTVPAAVDPATVSPLADYAKLWENDPNAKKETPFSFNSDPAKLLETAKGVDFTKTVSPEVMARIAAGGSDGQKAMMEAVNNASQLAFAQSAHASAKITESALQAQETRFKEMLPALIKQHSVADSFRQDNPLMSDPAMAPMVDALQQQFTKQYPNATAGDINRHVNTYLDGAASKIQASRAPAVQAKAGRAEQDWGIFFQE